MRKLILSLFFLSPIAAWAVYEKMDSVTIRKYEDFSVEQVKGLKAVLENTLAGEEADYQEHLGRYTARKALIQAQIDELDAILAQYK